MNYQSKRFYLSFAEEKDDEDILELYESLDYKGNISILYTKRPSPVKSLKLEGELCYLPIIRERGTGRLAAVGSLVIRKSWIKGELKRAGYLGTLKIHKEYRNKVPYISKVYNILYEETKDMVDVYYTTILSENIEAMKILEKPRKNMPTYKFVEDYVTFFYKTGVKSADSAYRLEKGLNGEVWEYIRRNYKEDLAPNPFDFFNNDDFEYFAVRNSDNEILGAFCIWDQSRYKQYIVTEYRGLYKIIKNLPVGLLGYPSFPEEKKDIKYSTLSFVAADNRDVFKFIVDKACESAAEYDFLMIGSVKGHSYFGVLDKRKGVKYRSKLYTVEFREKVYEKGGEVWVEVGLL